MTSMSPEAVTKAVTAGNLIMYNVACSHLRFHYIYRFRHPFCFHYMMMEEAMDDSEKGVKLDGYLLRDVRFADDQGMMSNAEKGV